MKNTKINKQEKNTNQERKTETRKNYQDIKVNLNEQDLVDRIYLLLINEPRRKLIKFTQYFYH